MRIYSFEDSLTQASSSRLFFFHPVHPVRRFICSSALTPLLLLPTAHADVMLGWKVGDPPKHDDAVIIEFLACMKAGFAAAPVSSTSSSRPQSSGMAMKAAAAEPSRPSAELIREALQPVLRYSRRGADVADGTAAVLAGLLVLADSLQAEVAQAVARTAAQDDPKFADGQELEKLAEATAWCLSMTRGFYHRQAGRQQLAQCGRIVFVWLYFGSDFPADIRCMCTRVVCGQLTTSV